MSKIRPTQRSRRAKLPVRRGSARKDTKKSGSGSTTPSMFPFLMNPLGQNFDPRQFEAQQNLYESLEAFPEWLQLIIMGFLLRPISTLLALIFITAGGIWGGDHFGWWHLYLHIGPVVLPPAGE